MTDQLHRPKPSVLLVLRVNALSSEERLVSDTSCWGSVKTLKEPPVQVSAADSWGFPDIDLFFIRLLSSTYTMLCDWWVLQHGRCNERVYTNARTSWPHRPSALEVQWMLCRLLVLKLKSTQPCQKRACCHPRCYPRNQIFPSMKCKYLPSSDAITIKHCSFRTIWHTVGILKEHIWDKSLKKNIHSLWLYLDMLNLSAGCFKDLQCQWSSHLDFVIKKKICRNRAELQNTQQGIQNIGATLFCHKLILIYCIWVTFSQNGLLRCNSHFS